MSVTTLSFGTTSTGFEAHLYLLSNAAGMTVGVTDFGACIVSARVPDAQGNLIDVALGHAGVAGYEHNNLSLGATVGRNANRIAGATFALDGTRHLLEANEGENSLHSGPDVWFQRPWRLAGSGDDHVTLALHSRAGDQGFPGEASVEATFTLTDDNRLTIYYCALPSERTVINLTNHTYWNLDGHASGLALDQVLSVYADAYTPTDQANIPTGELASVEGTCFDLRVGKRMGDLLDALPDGLDHNFCLPTEGSVKPAARLSSPRTGIVMDLLTDAPGLQVYMGKHLELPFEKDGARYEPFSGVALEAQRWPDAIHHPDWPSVVYEPGRPFVETIEFAFSVA